MPTPKALWQSPANLQYMEIITGIGIAIGGILLVVLLRSLTTFFHEMGHAVPALLFTREKVEVFVGSYGDLHNALQLQLGRLKLYLKFAFKQTVLKYCTPQKFSTRLQRYRATK